MEMIRVTNSARYGHQSYTIVLDQDSCADDRTVQHEKPGWKRERPQGSSCATAEVFFELGVCCCYLSSSADAMFSKEES